MVYYQRIGGYVPAGTPFDARGAKAGNRIGFITNLTPTPGEAATKVWSESAAWGAVGAVDLGPDTCENIWNHVPISRTLMHGRYSGPEVFTNAAEVGQHWQWTAKPENRLAYPIPGDIVLYVDPPPRLQLNYLPRPRLDPLRHPEA